MKLILAGIALLLLPLTVAAEDVVTFSGTTYLDCHSIGDTNVFLTDPNDYATVKPGFIVFTMPHGCDSLAGIPTKYRKVVSNQVVAMTQTEKDAVDAPAIAAAALQQSYTDEINGVTGDDLCNAGLPDIVTKLEAVKTGLDGEINGMTALSGAKTVLLDMNMAYATALKKIARCVRARAR